MKASFLPIELLYAAHIEEIDSVSMEASLLSVHLLSITHAEMAYSLSEWRPPCYLYKNDVQLV